MDHAVQSLVERLGALPGVLGVTLGGSQAMGRAGADSDWDLGVYYRESRRRLDPDDIRALGYAGMVSEHGEWGPVMLGGAWLTVGDRRVDVHYRDLDLVERWLADARQGRFDVHVQGGYLAGAPTYTLVGELAVAKVLLGDVRSVTEYPAALRRSASAYWSGAAAFALRYAEGYIAAEDALGVVGCLIRAVLATGHARMAQEGRWVLNEKRLVDDAGLAGARGAIARASATDGELRVSADAVRALLGPPSMPPM